MEKEKLKIKAEIRKVEKEGSNLKGFADLTIAGIVIKDVAVKEMDSKEGKYFVFEMPLANKYENSKGEMVYIHTADLSCKDSEQEKNLIKEVRKVITNAMLSEKPNEYGRYVAEKEAGIEYDKDFVLSYANPINADNYPSLRAIGTVYVGGVLRLNQVRLTEYFDQEKNADYFNVNFSSKKFEKEEAGTVKVEYKEEVFPIEPGLRKKIASSMQEAYIKELEKEAKETTQNEEDIPSAPEEDEEDER